MLLFDRGRTGQYRRCDTAGLVALPDGSQSARSVVASNTGATARRRSCLDALDRHSLSVSVSFVVTHVCELQTRHYQ